MSQIGEKRLWFLFIQIKLSLNGKWSQLHMLAKITDAQPHMVLIFIPIDVFSGISYIHELSGTHTHRCTHVILSHSIKISAILNYLS